MKDNSRQTQIHTTRKLVLVAFILGVFLFVIQNKHQKNQSKLASLQIKNQENYQRNGIKFLSKNILGLDISQFDKESFYELNPDNSRISIYSNDSRETKDFNLISGPGQLSSFIINSRVDHNELNYISACLPRNSVLSWHKLTYQNLLKNDVWPFVSEYKGKMEVHCCPKDDPSCRYNNVIDNESKYVVQMFRYDPLMSILRPILTKAEFGSVSSAGFFLVANKHFKDKFHARFFTLYNECLSQKIVFGKSNSHCSKKISFKFDQIDGTFKNKILSDQNLLGQMILPVR